MVWGSFTKTHLLTLALAVLINVFIYLVLKRNTRSKQIIALFLFSLFGAGVVLFSLFSKDTETLKNLPLSFWSLNAILLPFAVLFRGKKLCNLLLIWSFSSIYALVFNGSMANVEILTFDFMIYYTMHLLGAGIPILLFELNLVKREVDTIKSTVKITLLAYTAVHFINVYINSACGWSATDGVNYMSTLAPTTSLLSFFNALIPLSYFYMLPAIPLLLIYLLYWYLPEILEERRKYKPLRKMYRDVDRYYEEYEEEYIDEIIDEKYEKLK